MTPDTVLALPFFELGAALNAFLEARGCPLRDPYGPHVVAGRPNVEVEVPTLSIRCGERLMDVLPRLQEAQANFERFITDRLGTGTVIRVDVPVNSFRVSREGVHVSLFCPDDAGRAPVPPPQNWTICPSFAWSGLKSAGPVFGYREGRISAFLSLPVDEIEIWVAQLRTGSTAASVYFRVVPRFVPTPGGGRECAATERTTEAEGEIAFYELKLAQDPFATWCDVPLRVGEPTGTHPFTPCWNPEVDFLAVVLHGPSGVEVGLRPYAGPEPKRKRYHRDPGAP